MGTEEKDKLMKLFLSKDPEATKLAMHIYNHEVTDEKVKEIKVLFLSKSPDDREKAIKLYKSNSLYTLHPVLSFLYRNLSPTVPNWRKKSDDEILAELQMMGELVIDESDTR